MAAPRTIGNRLAPPRFLIFFALLLAAVGMGLAYLPRAQAFMIGFDLAAAIFLLSCIPLFRNEADAMRQAASENDANRVVLLVLTLILSLVILVTVAGELTGQRDPTIADKLLVVVTLALAWTGANMVYALHYAHLYYSSGKDGRDLAGLDFPGDRPEPDYADFVYFAFTLGITANVGRCRHLSGHPAHRVAPLSWSICLQYGRACPGDQHPDALSSGGRFERRMLDLPRPRRIEAAADNQRRPGQGEQ